MNKKDLVQYVRNNSSASLTVAQYEEVVGLVFDGVREGLGTEGVVRVHKFGTFSVKEYAPRNGRNPQTGEVVKIPGRTRVKFKPSTDL